MEQIVFACLAAPGSTELEALILARSIRAFAGALAGSPIWVLVPEIGRELAAGIAAELDALAVRRVPFAVESAAWSFPLAGKVYAAAAAESLAGEQADLLAWMDADSIVVQEPRPLLLEAGKALGYRPVDHTLIGSPYAEPLDPFWAGIYAMCEVPEARVFPMITSVDQKRIRPYFNAGLLVVRPARGILGRWRDGFERLHREPVFEPFYQQNVLYRIFMHQAVLAGTVLASLASQELQELPYRVSYPLHLHAQYPPSRRPKAMNELITCRYDTFFQDPDWRAGLPVQEPLAGWLADQIP